MMISLRSNHLHNLNKKYFKIKKKTQKRFVWIMYPRDTYDLLENLLTDFLNKKYPEKARREKD